MIGVRDFPVSCTEHFHGEVSGKVGIMEFRLYLTGTRALQEASAFYAYISSDPLLQHEKHISDAT